MIPVPRGRKLYVELPSAEQALDIAHAIVTYPIND